MAVVPKLFGTRDQFHLDSFSTDRGEGCGETGGGAQEVMGAKLCPLATAYLPLRCLVTNRPGWGTGGARASAICLKKDVPGNESTLLKLQSCEMKMAK